MILVLTLLVWCASPQSAKPPSPTGKTAPADAPAPPPPPSPARLVEQARAARAKGDARTALRLLDEAIEKEPTLRDAARLKIDLTAASGNLADAFAAYDRYVATSQGRGDRSLLSPIAKAALRELRGNDLAEVRASALAALAASGDAAAKKELEKAAAGQEAAPSMAVDAALARIGDETAAARFAERIRQGSLPSRLSALEATRDFGTAPPSLARAVLAALGDNDLAVRAAAVQTAGRLKITEALPALRRTLAEPGSYLVRLSAAVSLHRLGDPAGDDLLRQALAGDIVEAKVFAASAFTAAESRIWRPDSRVGSRHVNRHRRAHRRRIAAGVGFGSRAEGRSITRPAIRTPRSGPVPLVLPETSAGRSRRQCGGSSKTNRPSFGCTFPKGSCSRNGRQR